MSIIKQDYGEIGGKISSISPVVATSMSYQTTTGKRSFSVIDTDYVNYDSTTYRITFKKQCKIEIIIAQGSGSAASSVSNTLVIYKNGSTSSDEIYRKTVTASSGKLERECIIDNVAMGDYFEAYFTVNNTGFQAGDITFAVME